MKISINSKDRTPYYKQLVESVTAAIRSGEARPGDLLPSMNELSDELGISKETVKKAYSILSSDGRVEPRQGKGFFVCNPEDRTDKKVLLIFDKLSTYKDILLNSMASRIGDSAQITIRLHNQSVELLKYYLDECLDSFDYYVVTPHFPLDDASQRQAVKQLKRIPNRKLIILDHWIKGLPGNYGVVYQDYMNDTYECLTRSLKDVRKFDRLNVVIMRSSLYHDTISTSIKRFCTENSVPVEFHNIISDRMVRKGELYLLLNGQLDSQLNELAKTAGRKNLQIGEDIGIISFNDSPINELVLGGLTTISSDFAQMGELAAGMILDKKMSKIKCGFGMTKRATF